MNERLAEIKAILARPRPPGSAVDPIAGQLTRAHVEWLVSEVENTDNRIENYLAKLNDQRAANARMQRQVESLKAEVHRRRPAED
jgi:hypothetical protein